MTVCYKCKVENDNLYEIKSLVNLKRKEYFCRDCYDTSIEKCKCCNIENYSCYMYTYGEDLSSHYEYDEDVPFYFCNVDCVRSELGNDYSSCHCCGLVVEIPYIYSDMNDNIYCSSYCASKNKLKYCAICNKYNDENEVFVSQKIKDNLYYQCFSHGKCKTCKKNNFIKTNNKNILKYYYNGFCSKECELNLGNVNFITKENMIDVFVLNDKLFIKKINENKNIKKIEMNQYKNLFNVYGFFEKNLGWRHAHTQSEVLYKEINNSMFIIGRGFVFTFSDKPIGGRKGWLYNYAEDVDLKVIRELATKYKDFEYALYFFEGRINKFL